MTMQTHLLFMYTESSLHAGTGSTVSVVDLPIQRERTTQYPIVQGSGVKGALRSSVPDGTAQNEVDAVFGPDTKNASEFAGAVSVGDAHVVLFPVRSLNGVFAYATCPQVLARLQRDGAGIMVPTEDDLKKGALITTSSAIAVKDSVVLEEFSFNVLANNGVDAIAGWLAANALPAGVEYQFWRDKLLKSLIILPDNDFRDFVVSSTEITTHVRLQPDTKTVANGALWTQEALPADTLLVSRVVARTTRSEKSKMSADAVAKWLYEVFKSRLQMGGDETTGQGMVAVRWQKVQEQK